MTVEYTCCDGDFMVRIVIIIGLVLFAGLMSGLTLGLMSLSLVDLEVLAKSGKPAHSSYAEKILPVVRKQHLLLCTLLICNAASMEALPIFLDGLVSAWGAILISVTLILLFGEIIPQSICSRYGLAVGATIAPFVRLLVWLCFPVAYPISKLLDFLLGEEHDPLFRRAELKTLLDFHGNEAGKGGELTRDETTIIAGVLELGGKTASDAMTPIDETFAVDVNAKLDRNLMKVISQKGHSRIPIYHEQPKNIIGLVLVKNLLRIKPDAEVLVKRVAMRKIPRVSETMPLYDILNEFQKGHSHMAVVVRRKISSEESTARMSDEKNDIRLDIPCKDRDANNRRERASKTNRTVKTLKKLTEDATLHRGAKRKAWSKDFDSDFLHIDGDDGSLPEVGEEGEAVGIITLEDVIEELLQEEIYDETDHRNEFHHLPMQSRALL